MFIYVYMQQSVLNKSLLKFPDQKVYHVKNCIMLIKLIVFKQKCSQKDPASTKNIKNLIFII